MHPRTRGVPHIPDDGNAQVAPRGRGDGASSARERGAWRKEKKKRLLALTTKINFNKTSATTPRSNTEDGLRRVPPPRPDRPKEDSMTTLKRLGTLNRAGMDACREERYEDALFQLTQAERMARLLESPLHEAKVRNNMGIVHQLSGRDDEALKCYRLAERMVREQAGTDNGLYRSIARNMKGARGARAA